MSVVGKNVIVMPGVASQVPLLRKLWEMGCHSYVINPSDQSPAYAYAVRHLKADIFDHASCLNFAQDIHADAIVSDQCDVATMPVARLAADLGLKGIDLGVVDLFRDKFAMRQFSARHNLNPVESRLCRTVEEAREFVSGLRAMAIMKPLDSNSSRGVFTVNAVDDVDYFFEKSIKWSISKKAVVCERFINGTEFTIDGIKIPGQGHKCLAISEKRHFAHNSNIACELYFSHHNDKFDYQALQEINNRYVDLSGLEFGTTHAEYKYEDGKFYLIEIGARGGGGFISSHIVPCMSGVDNLGILVRMSLGESVDPDEIRILDSIRDRCAVLRFFDFAAGHVRAIDGEDFLKANPKILDYHFNFKAGDTIEKPSDDSKRVGYYIAYGDTSDELRQLMCDIEAKVVIKYW